LLGGEGVGAGALLVSAVAIGDVGGGGAGVGFGYDAIQHVVGNRHDVAVGIRFCLEIAVVVVRVGRDAALGLVALVRRARES
jgi:hypothetical protein